MSPDIILKINTPPPRKSNFEALRLLCMLMVLNLHSFFGYEHGSGLWQALDFFRESTSVCAVDCFILISGYFGIKWKFKSIFNLIFQIFFYSIGIYLVVIGVGIVEWNLKDFLMRFACLITQSWGFAVNYVLLWFCSPALNALAEKTTARELFFYVVVFFCVINFISVPSNEVFTYALVYMVGRFLNKIELNNIKFGAGILYWITTVLLFVSVYFLLFNTLHITDAATVNGWPVGFLGYDYKSPLVILQAVFLFLVFAKLNFQNKFVNWCAASCFSIFLIHMHPTIKQIGYYSFTENLYNYSIWQHILILAALFVIVFFGSIMIDKFRIIISDLCYWMVIKIGGIFPTKKFKVEACSTTIPAKDIE